MPQGTVFIIDDPTVTLGNNPVAGKIIIALKPGETGKPDTTVGLLKPIVSDGHPVIIFEPDSSTLRGFTDTKVCMQLSFSFIFTV